MKVVLDCASVKVFTMSTYSDLAVRNLTSREAVHDWQPIIARIGQGRRLRAISYELANISSRRESGTLLIRRFRPENLDRDQNGIRPVTGQNCSIG